MKIAEALRLREQLKNKVAQLERIKLEGEGGLLETKITRQSVTDQIDQITMQIPKVTLGEVTAEYDKYATALRKCDLSIQQANWAYDVDFDDADNPLG